MKAAKTRKRKLKQRTRGSNKLQGRRTVKSRIRGGVKRPLSLLNIDDINMGYTENKPMAKAAAIDDFIESKRLDANDVIEIRQSILPVHPDNIVPLFGKEFIDGNKHVSARNLKNGVHYFKTRVFLHKDFPDTQLIKLYEYTDDSLDFVFAYEAFIQKKAEAITDCDVQIPKIYQSGKYILQNPETQLDQYYFFIVMEKFNFDSLRDYLIKHANQMHNCETIADKINRANNCLNDHGIRHGDLNVGNIFIKPTTYTDEDISIGLIDFGQAGPSTPSSPLDEDYSCDKLNRLSERLQTMVSPRE